MAVTMDAVQAALNGLMDPNTQKDFVTSKEVKNINVDGDTVSLEIELGYPANSQLNAIRNQVVGAVKAVPGVASVNVNVSYKIVAHAVQGTLKPLKGVKNIVDWGIASADIAIRMATEVPARSAHIEDKCGSIMPGRDADFVVFDHELTLVETYVGGQSVGNAFTE